MPVEETLETIAAMCTQEVAGYVKRDWNKLNKRETSSTRSSIRCTAVNTDCREKIVAWFFAVASHCKFSPETVEITISMLDRFLATPEGESARNDRSTYQLASVAALYTAVKIHEPAAMDPQFVSRLCRGTFSSEEILEAELVILNALRWRVNPPTTSSFVRAFMDLIPSETIDRETRWVVSDLSQYLSGLAMGCYKLMTVPTSIVAYCALTNALESVGLETQVTEYIDYVVTEAIQIDSSSDFIIGIKDLLYETLVEKPEKSSQHCSPPNKLSGRKRNRGLSLGESPRGILTTV